MMLGRIAFIASCATVFTGTAYVVGVALSPPPSYTVSNQQRLQQYNTLAHGSTYEKKTRGQEFYLGISRWRRRLLREEGLVRGRVLEVGAGCGGITSYYDAVLQPQSATTHKALGEEKKADVVNSADTVEVILSDRSPGMVEAAAQQIQQRYGYSPYRYPDYDVTGILDAVKGYREKEGTSSIGSTLGHHDGEPQRTIRSGVVKRKVVHSDGSIMEVSSTPLVDDEGYAIAGETVAPILQGTLPGNMLPLLSKEGRAELQRRNAEKETAQQLKDGEQANRQMFAVANYAAEQLPFENDTFDTVVDMFGLCSFDDPVRALREMSRVCKPSGHLLLLEHGKGRWSRLNDYLDKWAPRHAKMWGCWWNRDIRRYMRLAGLTVLKTEEKHFGTSQYIVARPFKTMDEWEAYNSKSMRE
ncbi:hypothetical protein DQ04_03271010 [Trypanosoma grayi]|uniref:hypothetical protein n=1 Tax=Trypanosoma grayi TaxID=71804 RepID=UPI0004F4582B|nr:hypothetical protein DQ04_03271010 [Trypanosoma grayi]KEG10809.1 hypothetical protein DQ04_03271010 [Trypanosoma grayi]